MVEVQFLKMSVGAYGVMAPGDVATVPEHLAAVLERNGAALLMMRPGPMAKLERREPKASLAEKIAAELEKPEPKPTKAPRKARRRK